MYNALLPMTLYDYTFCPLDCLSSVTVRIIEPVVREPAHAQVPHIPLTHCVT